MRLLIKLFSLLLALSVISMGYFITYTESGLQWGVNYVTRLMPGKLSIQHTSGKLLSQFTLQNISYRDSLWQFDIKSMRVSWVPLGLLRDKIIIDNLQFDDAQIKLKSTQLASAVNLSWLRYFIIKRFVVNKLSIKTDDAEFAFNGTLAKTWDATWSTKILHLATVLPHSSGSITASGSINGPQLTPNIIATLRANQLTFGQHHFDKIDSRLSLNFHPKAESQLSLTAYGIKSYEYSLPKLALNINGRMSREREKLSVNLNILLAQQHQMNAQLVFPKFTHFMDFDQAMTGKINFNSKRLDLLSSYLPDIKNPRGTVQGNFAVNGTLGKPQIAGDVNLLDGRLTIPRLGITLDKIKIRALCDKAEQITYQGSFQSGTGSAQLNGTVEIAQKNFPITLALQGKNLQIFNLEDYKISASPNLKLSFEKQQLQIQGDISIPHADITPKNFGNTITLPNEVIIVDQIAQQISLPFEIGMNVDLYLNDDIHFAYDELQTYLSGHLHITQQPNRPATATGELHASKGSYKAYGQTLIIQEGRLLYTGGSLLNPGLNIRAGKQVKTVTVSTPSSFVDETKLASMYAGTESLSIGLQIDGTFERPKISLYSNPSGMKQSDILSYLTMGRPQSQNNGPQSDVLIKAVSALNVGGKSKLTHMTQQVQDKLGLSELNVESADVFDPTSGKVASKPTFVIGKEITPNLYAHYSVGLFDPVKVLNVRYQLSKRFAIQSETSSMMGNGADLVYSIERD